MLSSVLKSERAIKVNIFVIRAFVAMRKMSKGHLLLMQQIESLKNQFLEHDVQLSQIYDTLENLLDKHVAAQNWPERKRIGFKNNSEAED